MKERPLLEYLSRSIASLSLGDPIYSSWFTRMLGVVEAIYYGTFGNLVILTLAGFGLNGLVRKGVAARKAKRDKLY